MPMTRGPLTSDRGLVERRQVNFEKTLPNGDVVMEGCEDLPCLGCGKTIGLWYNGGELDMADCCGYHYELKNIRIDLVVTKAES